MLYLLLVFCLLHSAQPQSQQVCLAKFQKETLIQVNFFHRIGLVKAVSGQKDAFVKVSRVIQEHQVKKKFNLVPNYNLFNDETQGLTGLRGPDGMPGDIGPEGPMGAKGQKGDVGRRGIMGADGYRGDPGVPGFRGTPGIPVT